MSTRVSKVVKYVHYVDFAAQDQVANDTQDPYFAMIEDPRRPGKLKKVKKQIPAYIPEHDAEILAAVRRRAYRLDCCLFSLFGIRFGWEAVIGLIPAAGDAIGVALALLVMKKAMKVEGGLDNGIKVRMLINIAVDFLVGLVPFIGDLADAAFKCNTKNLRLLEECLDKKHKPQSLQRDERDFIGVDKEQRRSNRKSGIYMKDDPPAATAFDDSDDEDRARAGHNTTSNRVQEPAPARVPEDSPARGGWLSSSKSGGRDQGRAEPRRGEMRQETGSVRR